ncbi:unnamed protein product [Effrenium voratum]|nr:unnamed protein product [Effrenium voratum]
MSQSAMRGAMASNASVHVRTAEGAIARCEAKRKRRTCLELVADCLKRLSPAQRLQTIARLAPEQRRLLERHLMTQATSPVLGKSSELPVSRKRGLGASPEKRRFSGKPRHRIRHSACSGQKECKPRRVPKGLSSKRIRGLSYFFASVGCESLIFRTKAVRSRAEAVSHLEALQRFKCAVHEGRGSLEDRVRAAAGSLMEHQKAAGLQISVRSATQHWLGRDLHTPAWRLAELDLALDARRRLQAARGTVLVGGAGLLYQCSVSEATTLWARLRKVYLEVCASVPHCDLAKRISTLNSAERSFATRHAAEVRSWL